MNKIEYLLERKIKIKLDGSALRLIAMCAMFIDHFALMVIGNGALYGYRPAIHEAALNTISGKNLYILYVIMRSIGRMSFPIFCFLLVEGFIHSKNLFKYAVRLLMLAILSEIPYNLVCGNSLMYFEKQNTIWTLLLSLIMLFVIKKFDKAYNIIISVSMKFLALVVACIIAYILHLDYNIAGVILIFCIYYFRNDKNMQMLCIAIISFMISFVEIGTGFRYFGAGILVTPILFIYNGKSGYLHKYMNYYYLFYPLHLLILYGVVFFTYIKI